MIMSLEDVKIILDEYPRKEKWKVLGQLIDAGILENREYQLNEIAYITGVTKQAIKAIEKNALEKLSKFKNKF